MTDSEARAILQLNPGYTPEDLKRAYRVLAKKTHPDAGGSSEEFLKVKAAYDALTSKQNEVLAVILTHDSLFNVVRVN